MRFPNTRFLLSLHRGQYHPRAVSLSLPAIWHTFTLRHSACILRAPRLRILLFAPAWLAEASRFSHIQLIAPLPVSTELRSTPLRRPHLQMLLASY